MKKKKHKARKTHGRKKGKKSVRKKGRTRNKVRSPQGKRGKAKTGRAAKRFAEKEVDERKRFRGRTENAPPRIDLGEDEY